MQGGTNDLISRLPRSYHKIDTDSGNDKSKEGLDGKGKVSTVEETVW